MSSHPEASSASCDMVNLPIVKQRPSPDLTTRTVPSPSFAAYRESARIKRVRRDMTPFTQDVQKKATDVPMKHCCVEKLFREAGSSFFASRTSCCSPSSCSLRRMGDGESLGLQTLRREALSAMCLPSTSIYRSSDELSVYCCTFRAYVCMVRGSEDSREWARHPRVLPVVGSWSPRRIILGRAVMRDSAAA